MEEPSNAWPSSSLSASNGVGGKRHMVFFTAGISKSQINELDFIVLDHFQNIGYRHIFLQTRMPLISIKYA